jgi:hypothetical protein
MLMLLGSMKEQGGVDDSMEELIPDHTEHSTGLLIMGRINTAH